MQKTQVQSLGQEDLLEQEMATYLSILARRIPWTEEPGRLQFIGWPRVGRDLVTKTTATIPEAWSTIETGKMAFPEANLDNAHPALILGESILAKQTEPFLLSWKVYPSDG